MKYQLGVVVLNFNNYEDTIRCVDSIGKQKKIDVLTVIVDNGSRNDSYSVLSGRYKGNTDVSVLKLNSNYGYAKGNNAGIRYLLSKGIRSIFLANSDLLFSDEDILFELNSGIGKHVGVVIPTIKNPDGNYDQRVIYKASFIRIRLLKKILISIAKKVYMSVLGRRYPIETSAIDFDLEYDWDKYYIISGSGYLLTPSFFDIYHGIFSKTFLYGEEEATIILLVKSGLKSKVVKTGTIIHKGGTSTPHGIKTRSKERCRLELDSEVKTLGLLFTPSYIVRKSN